MIRELFARLGLDFDETAFKAADAVIEGLKTGMLGLVTGVAAVGAGLLEMARETANAGNDAYKLSLRLGTTTDAAQELAYAAELTGSSAESLQTSMFRMRREIEAAKEGSAEAQKALTGLGVPLRDLYKMQPDEQFTKLAGGLSQVKDESKKAKQEQEIFGRGVVDLIPLLEKGEEGIRALREEAHEMGLILSEETIKESREWKRQMHIAGEQVEALKFKVGAFVLHGLLKMTQAWREFKKVHAEEILAGIAIGVGLLSAATLLYAAANAGAIATTIGWYVALSIQALTTGASMAASWLMSIAPLAILTVGIVAFGLAVNDVYHFFKGDKATLLGKVVASWKADIHSAGDAARALLGTLEEIANTMSLGLVNKGKHNFERQSDEMDAAAVNKRTEERRRQRGMADPLPPPTYYGDLAPILNPAASFTAPSVQRPGAGVVAPSFQASFNITAQPGMDAKEIAGQVRTAIDDWHHAKVREAIAAVE